MGAWHLQLFPIPEVFTNSIIFTLVLWVLYQVMNDLVKIRENDILDSEIKTLAPELEKKCDSDSNCIRFWGLNLLIMFCNMFSCP